MGNAVRTKLESFKQPRAAKALTGKINTKDQYAPKPAAAPKLNTSLLRMALAQGRRGETEHNKQVMADSLGTVRSGTIARDSLTLDQIDATISGIDDLLKSLGEQ